MSVDAVTVHNYSLDRKKIRSNTIQHYDHCPCRKVRAVLFLINSAIIAQ